MCGIKPATLLSPKWNLDLQREMAMIKPGRMNPLPGPMGHGAPFQQFSGGYKRNDALSQAGISPAARPPEPKYSWNSSLAAPAVAGTAQAGPLAPLNGGQSAFRMAQATPDYAAVAEENRVVR